MKPLGQLRSVRQAAKLGGPSMPPIEQRISGQVQLQTCLLYRCRHPSRVIDDCGTHRHTEHTIEAS
ncbi:MAG: hypothetical protein AAF531_18655, partial [Actinomycetota bacterium]